MWSCVEQVMASLKCTRVNLKKLLQMTANKQQFRESKCCLCIETFKSLRFVYRSLGQNQMQDPKALKEHLLRRQQRIQHHTRRGPMDQMSQDSSQASSPIHIPYDSTTSGQASMTNESKTETAEYRRQLTLRRVLSENTAFNHDNPHPAPITAISPSK